MTQCQGPRAHIERLFLVFTYIRREGVAKKPKVPGAQARAK